MSHNSSPSGMPDAKEFLESVLDAPTGAKVTFGEANSKACPTCGHDPDAKGKAISFRQRCLAVRSIDRKDNAVRYPDQPPQSTYDCITFVINQEPDGRWSLTGIKNLEGLKRLATVETF